MIGNPKITLRVWAYYLNIKTRRKSPVGKQSPGINSHKGREVNSKEDGKVLLERDPRQVLREHPDSQCPAASSGEGENWAQLRQSRAQESGLNTKPKALSAELKSKPFVTVYSCAASRTETLPQSPSASPRSTEIPQSWPGPCLSTLSGSSQLFVQAGNSAGPSSSLPSHHTAGLQPGFSQESTDNSSLAPTFLEGEVMADSWQAASPSHKAQWFTWTNSEHQFQSFTHKLSILFSTAASGCLSSALNTLVWQNKCSRSYQYL